jgi:iron(III) transport system permease protein
VALSLLLGLLAVAVVATERLLGRRRVTTPGSRARRSLRVPLGRWRWPAIALVAGTVGASLVAPVAVLAFWAVRGLLNAEAAVTAMATDPASILQPALNTSWVGIVSAVVALAVVLPVAQLSARYRTRVGDVPNAMVVGGFALPGLVIALALAFWVRQIPGVLGLYQSFPLLVLAYVVHFGAQGLRAADVAVAGVPRHVEEAAKVLGAGRWRRFATIELPLMRPGSSPAQGSSCSRA